MRDIAATENGMLGCRLASVIFLSDEIQDRGNEGNYGLGFPTNTVIVPHAIIRPTQVAQSIWHNDE